jgi:hypothetical protein
MAVRVPSIHRNILGNAQANVCPILDNPGAGSRTNTPGAGKVERFEACTLERSEAGSEKLAQAIRPFVADRHGHTVKDDAIRCRL